MIRDRFPIKGDRVECSSADGNAAFTGTVSDFSDGTPYTSINGVTYVWVKVQHPEGQSQIWPSNKLGYRLPETQA